MSDEDRTQELAHRLVARADELLGETATPAVADFLLARIAEDEAAARAATESSGTGRHGGAIWDHIARHDPARVLAKCEADRRIVELAEDANGLDAQVDSEFVSCYRCKHCGDVVERDSAKAWIKSMCDKSGYRTVHLVRVTSPDERC